jgi:hypothetical protein
MKRFVLRELARQAPTALGSLLLGLIVLVGVLLLGTTNFIDGAHEARSAARSGLAIVMVTAPLFLGVATVAPDRESGALAFLVRFPLSRAAELAIRWGIAAGLAAAAIGVAALATWFLAGTATLPAIATIGKTNIRFEHIAVVGLVSGSVASIAFHRTLSALVAAPFLILLPELALAKLEQTFGFSQGGLVLACVPATALALVLAAIVAFFRGDLHRSGRRPLIIVLGVMALSTLLLEGAVSAREEYLARPVDRLSPWTSSIQRASRWFTDPSHRFVVKRTWRGPHEEKFGVEQYLLVAADLSSETALPGVPIAFSPDGSRMLGYAHGAVCLFAVGSGEIECHGLERAPIEPRKLELDPRSPPWVDVLAWRGDWPVFVKNGALMEAFGPRGPKPPGRIEAQGGSRLVCVEGSRRFVWDLNAGAAIPSSLDDLPPDVTLEEIVLSNDGARVAALSAAPGRDDEIFFMPVTRGRIDRVVTPALGDRGLWMLSCAVIFRTEESPRFAMLDYASGAVHDLGYLEHVRKFSPDGRSCLRGRGQVIDLLTGNVYCEAAGGRTPVDFLDADHVFRTGNDGALVDILDIRSGAVTPYR